MSVEVGQVWIDKDSRMNEKAVRVTRMDAEWGWYATCNPVSGWQSEREYRSALKRFPKAFRLANAR